MRNISIGIEVGSTKTRVVVGEILKGAKTPKILSVGEAETEGVRHGYILNIPLAAEAIKKAISQAEKNSGIKIRKAIVSLSGTTLTSETNTGEAIVSKADGEVTGLDLEKALEESESKINTTNKKILKALPLSFKLDGKEIIGQPEGLKGTKLEVKALFITCANQNFENLIEAITEAGVEPSDIIPSPFSAGNIVLSQKQKIVGTALVNLGAETTTLAVFENGNLLSLQTFSIGSADITNDLALGMKISLEKAEELKLGNSDPAYPKKKLDEIIEARLSDIFELIENHLKKIKRSGLLPAGIVFVGGGANLSNLENFAKEILGLPARIGTTTFFENNIKTKLRNPAWFSVLGLLNSSSEDFDYPVGSISNFWRNLKQTLKISIKQLLP